MKVAFMHEFPGYVGGAELTMTEFMESVPDGVKITKPEHADTVVVGNCASAGPNLIDSLEGKRRVVRYFNDMDPHGDHDLRNWFLDRALCVFTSPLHRRRWAHGNPRRMALVPPAVDVSRFRPPRQARRNGKRSGNVAVGAWQNTGKGQQALLEWSEKNGPVDVYGDGPFVPHGPTLAVKGPIPAEKVAQTLWGYESFVHLPTAIEPFGRAVVEAWAADCHLVVNGNVGAVEWILDAPETLEKAATLFWQTVEGA